MPNPSIASLMSAFEAVLAAEEALIMNSLEAEARNISVVVELLRDRVHSTIAVALAAPGDARQRVATLGHAADLEGWDSPLVRSAARLLVESLDARSVQHA